MTHSITKPTSDSSQYTPDELAQFTKIRRALKQQGLPRRETRDVAAAVQVAATFRRARALLDWDRPIAHGIAPLPSGGD